MKLHNGQVLSGLRAVEAAAAKRLKMEMPMMMMMMMMMMMGIGKWNDQKKKNFGMMPNQSKKQDF